MFFLWSIIYYFHLLPQIKLGREGCWNGLRRGLEITLKTNSDRTNDGERILENWLAIVFLFFFKKNAFSGSFNIQGYTFIEDNCQKFLSNIPTVHFSLKNTMFNMEQKVISKIRIIFPEISENFCNWFRMKTPNKGASREMDKHTDVIL